MPASFVVIRHVRPKLSCAKCDCVVQAEAPSRPIERGLAGSGLLAHVLLSKYCTNARCVASPWVARTTCGMVGDTRQHLVQFCGANPRVWETTCSKGVNLVSQCSSR